MSTELEEMVLATAELMQTRRQELFDVIRKRAAQGTGVVPPPKRIALTPIRPDMLNMIYLRGDGKKKMMKQLHQHQQQQVPPPPPATLAPPTPQRTPHTMGEDEEVAPTAVAVANLPYACETECSPSPEIADRSCLPGSPAQPKKTPEGVCRRTTLTALTAATHPCVHTGEVVDTGEH